MSCHQKERVFLSTLQALALADLMLRVLSRSLNLKWQILHASHSGLPARPSCQLPRAEGLRLLLPLLQARGAEQMEVDHCSGAQLWWEAATGHDRGQVWGSPSRPPGFCRKHSASGFPVRLKRADQTSAPHLPVLPMSGPKGPLAFASSRATMGAARQQRVCLGQVRSFSSALLAHAASSARVRGSWRPWRLKRRR